MRQSFLVASLLCLLSSPVVALELKGRLEWVDKAELRITENGIVEIVKVTTGQQVQRGDLLLKMDQRKQQAQLLETKAEIARAQLVLEDAQRDTARTQELFDRGLIAIEELKDAELKLAVAQSELESAKARTEAAQVALEHTAFHAPFDGIITASNAWQGAVIMASKQDKPLLSLAPNNHMLARALVTAEVLRRYPKNTTAQVQLKNGQRFQGKVYRHGVEAVRIEPEGAIYELDIIFACKASDMLRPAESVRLALP